jgi:hypothetical protein
MMGMFQMSALFSIRRPFRARPILIFVLVLNVYCQLGRWFCRFFQIPYQESPRLDYPIWYSFSWFFTSHTMLSVMTVVFHGGMLAMSWGQYAFLDWMIIGILTFTHCGGPLNLSDGHCWMNAVLLYIFAGYFALHGWRLGPILTFIAFVILADSVYWLTSNDILQFVPVKYHWIAVNFRLLLLKSGVPGALEGIPRTGYKGYICPLSYIWGVVGLQFFKRLPIFDAIAVAIQFVAGKIFMVHLIDMHPCIRPTMTPWLCGDSAWIGPFAYLRRSSILVLLWAILGCLTEIIRAPAFNMVEFAVTLGFRVVVGCCATVRGIYPGQDRQGAIGSDRSL